MKCYYALIDQLRNFTDAKVIIKKIQMDQMTHGDRQSILTEIKVLAMLHHPNVIEYFENFLQDKAMVIVMEYAAGRNLHQYLFKKPIPQNSNERKQQNLLDSKGDSLQEPIAARIF